MHITLLPEEVFFHLLPFLDLPDHHNLLLTCRPLFYKVVPALYRSPFRLLLAYNGKTSPQPLSPTPASSSGSAFPPIAPASASYSYSYSTSLPSYCTASDPSSLIPTSSTLYSTTRTTITPATATLTTVKIARSNSSIESNNSSHGVGNGINNGAGSSTSTMRHSSRRHTGNSHSLRKASASSVSSSSTSSTSSSSTHTVASALTTAASSYSPPSVRPTGTSGPSPPATAASTSASASTTTRPVHPSSLHQRSLSDHPKGFNPSSIGTSHSDTTSAHSKTRLSIITHQHQQQQQQSSTRSTGTVVALTPQRDSWKLKKMSRLLQLLIACTSIQARLPALRYPGYGQQWIRPPCRVDYLLYYSDQQEGGEIMIQCFHLLFADLVQCRWEDEARGLGVPLSPPDKEAYKVLYQIQREFMAHHPAGIRTLSVSVTHTIDHAITLAPQLGRVSRLELTDLEVEFKVEKVVDFIKSHRMVFGPVLKEISLKKRQLEGARRGSGASSPGLTRGAGGGYQGSISAASLFSFGSAGSPISSTATFPPHPSPAGIVAETREGGASSKSPPVALIQSLTNFSRSATTSSLTSPNPIMTVVEAIKGLECLDATNWDDCVLYLDRLSSVSLKRLWLSPNTPSSASLDYAQAELQLVGLAEQLKQWRQLEEIKMPIRKGNVFAWAANEKRSALICAPILAGSRTKRLPNMRQIHLEGPTLDVVDSVRDAAFAFQATLEDLEARSRVRVWHPTTIEWGWKMPRLTRLTLEGEISLYFSLDALNRCPALEELTLATSMKHYQHQHGHHRHYRHDQYQPPLSPLPHLTRGANPGGDLLLFIRSQEIRSIASLKNLQRLSLHGAWQVPDRVLRRIADKCLKLKELRLDQTVGTTTGGVLLGIENMQRLEKLELRLDVIDLSLVRVVARKLAFLSSIQLTNLCTVD
ncbi:hypothetical protein BG015_004099 [Linnemannia schmuckeri]|uniref:F-box domain-containing protein n=1 Tax=Linnemannia schmuckeri TaxID=64567 RepID=A0A9P5S4K0_9FUNG|nr:hypothetical protein BG015_004099 [Linnemannia schmuckeri]